MIVFNKYYEKKRIYFDVGCGVNYLCFFERRKFLVDKELMEKICENL